MGARTEYAPGTFCWTDLGTTDVDGAKAFYTGLFGWTFDHPMEILLMSIEPRRTARDDGNRGS